MTENKSVSQQDSPGPSLLTRAKQNDRDAITIMFEQFLPPDEQVLEAQYLGLRGCWGIGSHSLAALTPRRAASIRIGLFGELIYQDGALEHVNSGVVYQPSRFVLYLLSAFFFLATLGVARTLWPISIALSLITLSLGIALLPIVVRLYYRFKKSGLVLWIREGVAVYSFADRKRFRTANRYFREVSIQRELRLQELAAYETAQPGPRRSEVGVGTDDQPVGTTVPPVPVRTTVPQAPLIYAGVVSLLVIALIWTVVAELTGPDLPNVVSSPQLPARSGQALPETESAGVIGTITATPQSITPGGCFTLQWSTTGADSVAIDVDPEGDTAVDLVAVQASGSETLCSESNVTYYLWTTGGERILDSTRVTVSG
ncbi:MAG: hypothetical protein ACRDZO_08760 [Egibacteraceae bacterium]